MTTTNKPGNENTDSYRQILIYGEDIEKPQYESLKILIETICSKEFSSRLKMSSNLKEELKTKKYGLVIDLIGLNSEVMNSQTRLNERFATDSQLVRSLDSSVDLRFLTNVSTVFTDIIKIGSEYLQRYERNASWRK